MIKDVAKRQKQQAEEDKEEREAAHEETKQLIANSQRHIINEVKKLTSFIN